MIDLQIEVIGTAIAITSEETIIHRQIGAAMISIRIHLTANKGKQGELRQALETIRQSIIMEDGCLGCRVFQSLSNESELVLIEEWQNIDAAQTHVSSDNMAILAGAGNILTESIRVYPEQDPDIQNLREVFKARFALRLTTDS